MGSWIIQVNTYILRERRYNFEVRRWNSQVSMWNSQVSRWHFQVSRRIFPGEQLIRKVRRCVYFSATVLSGNPVEIVSSQDHLGLTSCSSSSATTSMIKTRLRIGLHTSYLLFGAGFHGLNGLNAVVSLKLWYTYVITRLTFELEAFVIPPKLVKDLDTYQYNTLYQLQHLPHDTSKDVVYLLLGVPPMEGHLDRKTISHCLDMWLVTPPQ